MSYTLQSHYAVKPNEVIFYFDDPADEKALLTAKKILAKNMKSVGTAIMRPQRNHVPYPSSLYTLRIIPMALC